MKYLPAARHEAFDAAAFYETRAPGLGDEFLDALERAGEAELLARQSSDVVDAVWAH